ncbi:hypothetical protein F4141_11485 [Candidatus Poribacteria bacterium]|nr:hypothetical protein [Candidatus Poribacteria bacterium]
MEVNVLHKYLYEIRNLRIDRAHGSAPHQPVLLLSIIEMIEQGQITENKIIPSPGLVETFIKYWTKVTNRKPKLELPFFHMKSRSFWHHQPNSGYETALSVIPQIKSFTQLRNIIAYGYFDDALYLLLTNAETRDIIQQTIIETYLLDFKEAIYSLISEEKQISEYSQKILQHVDHDFSIDKPFVPFNAKKSTRTSGFRKAIMQVYTYTCVICEIQILTLDGASLTEAAHIVPVEHLGNDDVRNGISLCQQHHWGFDNGLLSVNEVYKVIVSDLMVEKGPLEWKFTTLTDKGILLPENREHYPAPEAFAWHRENVFRK